MADNGLITQVEFAKRLGVKKQYINKLVKTGVIKLVGGKINEGDARGAIKAAHDPRMPSKINYVHADSGAGGSSAGSGSIGVGSAGGGSPHAELIKSKAIKERYHAGLAKMQYEEKAGIMVNQAEYDAALLKHLADRDTVLKNHILSIPTRCAMEWPDPNTRQELKSILEECVREVLTDMSAPELDAIKKEMK